MTTYIRLWLAGFVLGWLLSSVGYGQCVGRSCRPRLRHAGVSVGLGVNVGPVAPLPAAAPRQIAQAPSPQFEPAPMAAPAPQAAAGSHTIIQHPPVVVSVEPAPTIHVRAPQVIVQYQSGPPAPVAPPQASFAPPMPSKTLPSPQTRTVRTMHSVQLGSSVTLPVYRSDTRVIRHPVRRHLHWLD